LKTPETSDSPKILSQKCRNPHYTKGFPSASQQREETY
jgi:hypothetical protein